MTNLPKLSSRAAKALEVLSNGGMFVYRLEHNSYLGRALFKHHLKSATGGTIHGIGAKTFYELESGGFLCGVWNLNTSVSSYYKLRTATE